MTCSMSLLATTMLNLKSDTAMDDIYFGLLDREVIQSAMVEYRMMMERQGNKPRAALTEQLLCRLERYFSTLHP